MKDALVSIIVPVYNVESYIEECIESVLNQSYRNIELIIIDDCSTDTSVDKISGLVTRYKEIAKWVPRINLIRHKTNKGSSAARNTGIINSQGDYLFFLDGDDRLNPLTIQTLMTEMLKTDADIVRGDYTIISNSGNRYQSINIPIDRDEYNIKILNWCSLSPVVWGGIYKKTLFVNNNIFFLEGYNMGEDYCITSKLAYFQKKICYVRESVYNYRKSGKSISSSFSKTHAIDLLMNFNDIESFYLSKTDYYKYKKNLEIAKAKIKTHILYNLRKSKTDFRKYRNIFPELNSSNSELSIFSKMKIKMAEFSPKTFKLLTKLSADFS